MSKTQIRTEMHRQMLEYFDGYVLVAKVAGTKDVVIVTQTGDDQTKASILVGLLGLVHCQEFRDVQV